MSKEEGQTNINRGKESKRKHVPRCTAVKGTETHMKVKSMALYYMRLQPLGLFCSPYRSILCNIASGLYRILRLLQAVFYLPSIAMVNLAAENKKKQSPWNFVLISGLSLPPHESVNNEERVW